MNNKMNQMFKDQRNVHVLYSFTEQENYLNQVLDFIEIGIAAGDYVILIENSRLYPMIQKELSTRLTKEQLTFLHYVNSFDFYCSSGSYHPPAITAYFNKMIAPYLENKLTFRSWAHVEWATMEEPLHLIEDFEKIIDEAVNELSFPLICAYEGNRMPEYIKTMLLERHPYVLLEDDFVVSDEYRQSFMTNK